MKLLIPVLLLVGACKSTGGSRVKAVESPAAIGDSASLSVVVTKAPLAGKAIKCTETAGERVRRVSFVGLEMAVIDGDKDAPALYRAISLEGPTKTRYELDFNVEGEVRAKAFIAELDDATGAGNAFEKRQNGDTVQYACASDGAGFFDPESWPLAPILYGSSLVGKSVQCSNDEGANALFRFIGVETALVVFGTTETIGSSARVLRYRAIDLEGQTTTRFDFWFPKNDGAQRPKAKAELSANGSGKATYTSSNGTTRVYDTCRFGAL